MALQRNLFDPGPRDTVTSAGLLILRLWVGLSLLGLHGWSKFANFSQTAERFPDILGIGSAGNLTLVVFAEVVAAALVAVGLATRFASLVIVINLTTAFFVAHGGRLSGQGNGELAFLFLGGFLTLFLTGAGRFSLDATLFGARSGARLSANLA